ncbi:MAG: hypothetical protein KBD56_00855 [Candidatus Eisenbacteria bacterium]|nr:hypothetical protein [Candidatus Eisenbacteria bacterium]
MAVVKKNSPFEDLSGRVGDLVFRRRGGKTIVSRRPAKKEKKRPSTKPREGAMSRFREAVVFAREARHQPAFRSLCRQLRGASPYHLAIQDYLSIPSIETIDDRAVTASGGPLIVTVQELIAVREVRARIEGGAWMRARVMGLSAKPVARQGESVKEAVPSPSSARSTLTPADRFFRRVPNDSRASNAGPPQADLPGMGSDVEAPPARAAGHAPAVANAMTGEAAGQREGPSGDSGRNRSSANAQVSTWRIDLPRGGEIEIVAYDYAGNQAQEKRRVGPKDTEA